MSESTILCTVDPGLVGHVQELLAAAGLDSTAQTPAADGRVSVSVDSDDEEHARAVIGLVLPQLLAEPGPTPTGGLSDRLIRSEDPGPQLPGGLIDGTRTFGYADPLADHPEDASADFVPPEPPPLPRPRDRIAKAAWFGVLGGPIVLILSVVFGLPGILKTVGLIAFFGGFATLIFRMEERKHHGDGWDDGAVV